MTAAMGGTGPSRAEPRIQLRLELLEGFRALASGQEMALPLSAQRVLVFLAIHDRSLLRLHVASTLWMDCGEARALASLRTALWRMPAEMHGLITASATHLAIDRAVAVDVRALRAAIRRVTCDQTITRDDIEQLAECGDLMPDWYDDWLIMRREQLRQERLQALELTCERLTAEGRWAEATMAGLAAATSEPLRESAHRALVELHLRRGNQRDALRQYQLFADLLRAQLGLEPSTLMEELILPVRAA